jgi:hypothetical protein
MKKGNAETWIIIAAVIIGLILCVNISIPVINLLVSDAPHSQEFRSFILIVIILTIVILGLYLLLRYFDNSRPKPVLMEEFINYWDKHFSLNAFRRKKIETLSQQADVEGLAKILHSKVELKFDWETRCQAAIELGKTMDKRAVEPLKDYLQDNYPSNSNTVAIYGVIWALGKLKASQAVDLIAKYTNNDDLFEIALYALSEIGDENAVNILSRKLDSLLSLLEDTTYRYQYHKVCAALIRIYTHAETSEQIKEIIERKRGKIEIHSIEISERIESSDGRIYIRDAFEHRSVLVGCDFDDPSVNKEVNAYPAELIKKHRMPGKDFHII